MRSYRQHIQAMPPLRPRTRKGFASLPGSYQLVTFSICALILLVLWPGLLDPARMRGAESVKQGLKPKKPESAAQFAKRLEDHYTLTWLRESTPAQERTARLTLCGLHIAVVGTGAIAGQRARKPQQPKEMPLCFGIGKVRARAALL